MEIELIGVFVFLAFLAYRAKKVCSKFGDSENAKKTVSLLWRLMNK